MPSIHYMNAPGHPFWEFVQEMNDHPIRGAAPAHPADRDGDEKMQTDAEVEQDKRAKETSAEDPPEVDPSTVRPSSAEENEMPRRGRGRCGGRGGRGQHHGPEGRRGPPGCEPRHGDWPSFGPPPFLFGPSFWGQGPGHRGPHGRGRRCSPPGETGPEHGGPHGFGGPGRGRGGHPHGAPGPHGPHGSHGPHGPHERRGHHGPRGRHAPPPPPPGFNFREFMNDLGERIGMDLNGAAENLGLEKFLNGGQAAEHDFEPKADIFERQDQYIVHISLPGAKKEDVGVDWDGEHSILRVAGVVHRPGVDEEMLQQLIVDGRKREVGVFEKSIRLGTKHDPASIDVAGIKAKMTDGVLVINIPKLEIQHKKRDVPITSSEPSSPQNNNTTTTFGADSEIEMYDATDIGSEKTMQLEAENDKGKQKEMEHTNEKQADSPLTVVADDPVPAYQAVPQQAGSHQNDSDWEHYGSEDEGEYIKINVD